MAKIKLCGIKRECDIQYVNELHPEYIGFVFAKNSRRYVEIQKAKILSEQLKPEIVPVGVFVDEKTEFIISLIHQNIIKTVQLHGNEDEAYISELKEKTKCPIIKAFRIQSKEDIDKANRSSADYVLLDSGGGTGESFDWSLIQEIRRPYFLAGGLTPENVSVAIRNLAPYAVDASSSLETDGLKDKEKMAAFVKAVRERN